MDSIETIRVERKESKQGRRSRVMIERIAKRLQERTRTHKDAQREERKDHEVKWRIGSRGGGGGRKEERRGGETAANAGG